MEVTTVRHFFSKSAIILELYLTKSHKIHILQHHDTFFPKRAITSELYLTQSTPNANVAYLEIPSSHLVFRNLGRVL